MADRVDRLDGRIQAWTGDAAQVIDRAPATQGWLLREGDPLGSSAPYRQKGCMRERRLANRN